MNDKEWQLVPREPDERMIAEMEIMAKACLAIGKIDVALIYGTGVQAAPQPPEPGRLSGEREARAAFGRLGLKHWDAFWLGWCERGTCGPTAAEAADYIEHARLGVSDAKYVANEIRAWANEQQARAAAGSDEGACVGDPTRPEACYLVRCQLGKRCAHPDPLREVCANVAGELESFAADVERVNRLPHLAKHLRALAARLRGGTLAFRNGT